MSLFAILLSYLLGSIPTGLWLGLWLRGIDVRKHGSGNIGATNTLRVLGKGLGGITLLLDAAKGAIPVLIFARIGHWPELPLLCGLAAVFGHTNSLYLRLRGGKGIATGAGMYLALAPIATLLAAAVFAIVAKTTRIASAASLCATAALALVVALTAPSIPLRVITLVVAALVFWKHRANIKRLVQGVENKF